MKRRLGLHRDGRYNIRTVHTTVHTSVQTAMWCNKAGKTRATRAEREKKASSYMGPPHLLRVPRERRRRLLMAGNCTPSGPLDFGDAHIHTAHPAASSRGRKNGKGSNNPQRTSGHKRTQRDSNKNTEPPPPQSISNGPRSERGKGQDFLGEVKT